MRYLLDQGVDVHGRVGGASSGFELACEKGHVDVVDLLLERAKAFENETNSPKALVFSCAENTVDVLDRLLMASFKVNTVSPDDQVTPLGKA